MAEAFLGEIRLIGWNFAPDGWALCNGQLLSVSQNTALFSLLSTTYGGDGRVNFALPNLNGVVPIGVGQAASGTNYQWGQGSGSETTTIQVNNMPAHNHPVQANTQAQDATAAGPSAVLAGPTGGGRSPVGSNIYNSQAPNTTITPTGVTGSGAPVNNMQPYLPMYYIICTNGIYPVRP